MTIKATTIETGKDRYLTICTIFQALQSLVPPLLLNELVHFTRLGGIGLFIGSLN
jgi:hypothetical protein